MHHDVATSALLREALPGGGRDAPREIGDPQVRNRGTIGGSLAHADPSADYPAVMLALDAEIHIKGTAGRRAVKAADFFQDLFTVDLAPDEIIVGVQFAPVKSAAYAKLHQRASHYRDRRRRRGARRWRTAPSQSARIGLTGASHARRRG